MNIHAFSVAEAHTNTRRTTALDWWWWWWRWLECDLMDTATAAHQTRPSTAAAGESVETMGVKLSAPHDLWRINNLPKTVRVCVSWLSVCVCLCVGKHDLAVDLLRRARARVNGYVDRLSGFFLGSRFVWCLVVGVIIGCFDACVNIVING